MTAEAEGVLEQQPFTVGVGQGNRSAPCHRELHLGIEGIGVHAAGNHPGPQGLQRQDRLNGASAPQQMAQLPFGGIHRQVIGGGAEAAAQGTGLRQIAEAGAGGVGLHGTEIIRLAVSTLQGFLDRPAGLQPLGLGGDDVVRIAAAATGQQPAEGVAGWHIRLPHQSQHARPFRQHETVARLAVGAGGLLRRLIAKGEGAHGRKAHQTETVHGRFAAPGQHQIGAVVLQQPLRQHQGFGAGGTGGDGSVGAALQSEVDGHLAGCRIGDQHRNREWIDPAGPSCTELGMLLMHGGQPADAGAEHHGDAGWIEATAVVLRHCPGLPGGQQGELGAAVGATPQQGFKVRESGFGHTAGDADVQILGPGFLDGLDAGLPSADRCPGAVGVVTQGGQRPPADHGNALRRFRHGEAAAPAFPGDRGCLKPCGNAAAPPP